MTSGPAGIEAGTAVRAGGMVPQMAAHPSRFGESAAIARRVVLGCAVALLLAAVTGITYGIAPLYSANQNQYYLHGLARAGVGLLRDDWLAHAMDPTPVFSALVAATQRYLSPGLFYAYYLALAGAYAASLIGITRRVVNVHATRGGLAAYAMLLMGMHSAMLSRVSLDMLGLDVRAVLTSGVAGQQILGDYLQPSTFGVLLAASVLLFISGRAVPAALTAALAAVIHPTYLLHAGILVCAFVVVTYAESRRVRRAAGVGVGALALVLPIVVYVARAFAPTSPESLAAAQDVLIHVRLPHHVLMDRWLNLSAYAQIGIVAAGLYATRRTPRLFPVLALCAAAAAGLTVAQAATGSAPLALLFPWRLSVLLVPICSSVLAAIAVSWIRTRVLAGPARDRALAWSSLTVAAVLLLAGAAVSRLDAADYAQDPSVPVMDFVKETKAPGDVYLVPISMERFRLYSGAPIFADRKSIPYRDVELLEWHERYTLGRELHVLNDPDVACQALTRIPQRHRITHVVLRRGLFNGRCGVVQKLYEGGEFGVYRLVRR